ncbi:prepilin-type N-terminal cleavage/methylation domain-containing protein [Lysobacter fragariae]
MKGRDVHSPAAVGAGRPAGGRGAVRGFTLIEVLIATVLLAAGLALAFATIGAATKVTRRGEAMAAHSDRLRVVEGFLRRRLSASRPIPYKYDTTSGIAQRFEGEPDRVKFVADLPDYLGRGGPYLHELAVEDDGDGVRITLALNMVLAGQTIEEPQPRPPEVLVDGLKSVHFRYRTISPDGGLDDWMDRWENADGLPMLVEVSLTDANGFEWPPMVVALPMAQPTVALPVAR